MSVLTEINQYNQSELTSRHRSGGGKYCPVCQAPDWKCQPSIGATEGGRNCATLSGTLREIVNGYICVKTGEISVWVPVELARISNGLEESPQQKRDRAVRLAAIEAQAAAEEARRQVPLVIVMGRDAAYQALSQKSGIEFVSSKSRANHADRGMEQHLQGWLDSGAAIAVTPSMRQNGIANIWRTKNDSGMLWTIRSLEGAIVGSIFRGDDHEEGRKYVHNSTAEFPGYDETGRMPVHHIHGGNSSAPIVVIEGVAKANYANEVLDRSEFSLMLGVGSCVNFPGAAIDILAASEATGVKEVVILPDAGSFANPSVLGSYKKLVESAELKAAGVAVKIADFGSNYDKSGLDPDEMPIGTKLSLHTQAFKANLGCYATFVDGTLSLGQPAKEIRQMRSVNPLATRKLFKDKLIVLCSNRADDRGGIFVNSAADFRKFYESFHGDEGMKQRRSLAVTQKMFEAKGSEWMQSQLGLKVKLDSGKIRTVVSIQEEKQRAELTNFVATEKYLLQNAHIQNILAANKDGDRLSLGVSAIYGGGKTTLAKAIAANYENVIIITPTVALAENLSQELGTADRPMYLYSQINAAQNVRRFVTTIASMSEKGHLKGANWACGSLDANIRSGLVVIDEMEKILHAILNSDTARNGRAALIDALIRLIQNAQALLVCDANLTADTMRMLKSLRPDIIFASNIRPQKASNFYNYPTEADVLARLVPMIEERAANPIQGKAIAVNSDHAFANESSASIETLLHIALSSGMKAEDIICVNSVTQKQTDSPFYDASVEIAPNIQLVLYSPTWQEGISIEDRYEFAAVFGIYHGVVDGFAMGQGLHRVRYDCDRHFYAPQSQRERMDAEKTFTQAAALTESNYDLLDQHQKTTGGEDFELANAVGIMAIQLTSPADRQDTIGAYMQSWMSKFNARAENSRLELLSQMAEMYEVVHVTGNEMESAIASNCVKETGKAVKLQTLIATIESTALSETRFLEIQKGGDCTIEESNAFKKYKTEAMTGNAVKLETVEEAAKVVKGNKVILRGTRFTGESREEQIKRRAAMLIEGATEGNYTSDAFDQKDEAIFARLADIDAIEKIKKLMAIGAQGKWFDQKHPLFIELQSTIMSDRKLMGLLGQKRSKDRRQHGKVVIALIKWLGIDLERDRNKDGYQYRLYLNSIIVRIVQWRIENPDFEHKDKKLQLPRIAPNALDFLRLQT